MRGSRPLQKFLPIPPAKAIVEGLLRIQLWIWWRAIRPDIVHVNFLDTAAYRLACLGVRPLLLTIWGTNVNRLFFEAADDGQRARARFALRHADAVIVDSPDIARKCAMIAQKSLRTELMPLGIDATLLRPGYHEAALNWRRKLAIPATSKIIVSIRACQEHYGHEIILEAFARALPSLDGEAVLVFRRYNLSDGGKYETQLRRTSETLGVSCQTRWMDAVPYEDLPGVYALADLIVNFPDYDAFPVAFLEAAACGRPVVCCRLAAYAGSFAERVFRMTPPRDVETLAAAMVQELRRPTAASAQSRADARATVEREFNTSLSAAKLLAFVQRSFRMRASMNNPSLHASATRTQFGNADRMPASALQ